MESLLKHDTAGDPMTGLRWTRKTTEKVARELNREGIAIGRQTVSRLLYQLRYSLKVNRKMIARQKNPYRNQQFIQIAREKDRHIEQGLPVISVDAKKKEQVGNFKNAGAVWTREPVAVSDHDFRGDAEGMAIPYGVYDPVANRGALFVGTSHETSEFAAEAIARWWEREGRERYPEAAALLILCDSGGSSDHRRWAWKDQLVEKLCDPFGLKVTVCHYPPGASKWNPIEHRLFSFISRNWAGRPLDSYQTILNYARTTTTATGLTVSAAMLKGIYPTGQKVSEQRRQELRIARHKILPQWHYTLRPTCSN
jgi:hypothetical protein